MVVGGGPAGCEAPRTAAERGDLVVMFEADESLGGQLRLAREAPHRGEIGALIDRFERELAELHVDVRLGSAATAEDVLREEGDWVVVATGAVPRSVEAKLASAIRPTIADGHPKMYDAWTVLRDRGPRNCDVVVFDDVGHWEGISVAEVLLESGCRVHFCTPSNRLAPLLEAARLESTIKARLVNRKFSFTGDCDISEIDAGSVTLRNRFGGPDLAVAVSGVVLVTMNAPQRDLADRLAGRVPRLQIVGDALSPRFLQHAITEAHRAAA